MVPRISIGMPVYNAAPWLAESVRALLDQTFRDFDLIISDNASQDGSLEVAEALARSDSRVRVLRQERNIGANGNYLAVLGAARGELFKWASANDLCAPRFVERCVEALDSDPTAALAYPRTVIFDTAPEDGSPNDHDFELLFDERALRFIELFAMMHLNNAMNGVVRRHLLIRALPMGNFRNADILLMSELALLGKYLLIDEPLFYRRMSAAAATSRRGRVEADQHLVPTVRRPLLWQSWRYQLRLLRIVARALPYDRSWARIARYALRRVSWARAELAVEVNAALSRAIGR